MIRARGGRWSGARPVVRASRLGKRTCRARRRASARFVAVAALGLVVGGAVALPSASGTPAGGDWTTYGGSSSRLSNQATSAPGAPLQVAWQVPGRFGAIFGEPLIWRGTVYVATESDVVVALSASNGQMRWSHRLGQPVAASQLPCGDISPTVGVTSTMVLDQATGLVYASAEVARAGRVRHLLVALRASNGHRVFQRNLDLRWNPAAQLQRVALALDRGRVLVGFGGNFGDCGHYRGYLESVPASGKGRIAVFRTPTAQGDAIWAPGGVAVDGRGDIYLATGNGATSGGFDLANSVVELSPTLRRLDFYAPPSWLTDSKNDSDLGSTAPLLLPNGYVFIAGKSAVAHLLRAGHLGGVGPGVSSLGICQTWGATAYADGTVFVPCTFSGSMVALSTAGGQLAQLWRSGAAHGPPSVGGGVVWSVGGGHLVGLDPATGKVVDSLDAPDTEHFAAPAIGEGLVVVGGSSEIVAWR